MILAELMMSVPQEIREYIKTEKWNKPVMQFNPIEGVQINIYGGVLTSNEKTNVNKWFKLAKQIRADTTCSRQLNAHIFLSPHVKKLPSIGRQSISVEHANTAFTYACHRGNEPNNMIIFRREEWFRTLIHETIHAYGIDFAYDQTAADYALQLIKQYFGNRLNTKGNIFEVYTEMLAELMYIKITKKSMQKERQWAMIQCAKVLKHYEITVTDFVRPGGLSATGSYRENTNVLSYYLLRATCWFAINDFMKLLKRITDNFQFINTRKNVKAFVDFMLSVLSQPEFADALQVATNKLKSTDDSLSITYPHR